MTISLMNGSVSPEIAQAASPITAGGLSALQGAPPVSAPSVMDASNASPASPDNSGIGGANALALPPPPSRGSVSEDIRTQMMRQADIAAKSNPDNAAPGSWARNILAGAQSALAGVGSVGKVPEGAGGLYGAGKTLQYGVEQRQKAQAFAAEQKQRDIENQRQNALTQSEVERNQATTAHENISAMHESKAISQLDETANQALIDKGQKELASDLSSDEPPPIILKDATGAEITKAIQDKTVNPSAMHRILTGQRETGQKPDGTPIMENVYTIEGQGGPVKVSSDFARSYKDAFPNKPEITEGTTLPWVDYKYQKQLVSNVETAKEIQKDNERKLGIERESEETTAETNTLQQDPRFLKYMGQSGLNGIAAFQAAQADPQMVKDYPRMLKDFQGAVGNDVWDAQVKEATTKHDESAKMLDELENDPSKTAGDKGPAVVATAQARIADSLTPPDQKVKWAKIATQAQAGIDLASKVKSDEKKAETALQEGDPVAAGELLSTGVAAPSQLSSGRKPEFATAAFEAAKQYNINHGLPPFDAGTAEQQYKIAGSQDNVKFFTNANSLIDKNGTLEQLAALGSQLPQGSLPVFNNWQDFVNYQTGNPQVQAFKTMALGVADDYGQIMGAGATDSARGQVLQLTNPALSAAQRDGVAGAIRGAVNSKAAARIGNNPYLRKMYSGNPVTSRPIAATPKPGMVVLKDAAGNPYQLPPDQVDAAIAAHPELKRVQ